ncbi:unnamed protein product [Prunus armeniaca]
MSRQPRLMSRWLHLISKWLVRHELKRNVADETRAEDDVNKGESPAEASKIFECLFTACLKGALLLQFLGYFDFGHQLLLINHNPNYGLFPFFIEQVKVSDLPPEVVELAVMDFTEHFESLQVLDTVRCGESMICKLGNCVDKKLKNHYMYTLKEVEEDLKEITDVYIQESLDMEAVVKLRDEGKWLTGTNVVYEINLLQDEALKKVKNMARSAGLNVNEVTN